LIFCENFYLFAFLINFTFKQNKKEMKKLFTLAFLGVFAVAGLQAQNKTDFPTKSVRTFPVKKDANYYQMLQKYSNMSSRASRATVCDSSLELDLGLYDFLYSTTQKSLSYNGSWFEATPSIRANELTSFVDTFNKFNVTYVTQIFDSLAFIGGTLASPVFDYIPTSKATVYLDSVIIGYGLDADTATLNVGDSLKFTIQKLVGNTLTTVKSIAIVGQDLKEYVTGDFVNRATAFGINHQFAKGDIFAIRVQWRGADTSRHFFLTYGYADSCGTVTVSGQNFASPAYPSTFVGRMLAGEIRASGATATVSNYNNGYGYSIPGVPANCTFVYDQNYDIIPIIHICTDYSASIAKSTPNGCPGSTIDLEAKTFGVTAAQAANLTYTWSVTGAGATLTSNSGATTSLVLGAANATVYLTVADGANLTYDTTLVTSNGITATFANPNPSLACGGTLTLAPTTAGVQTGRTYVWNTGPTTNTLVVSTPGTYTVTVTNNRGCTATASASVTYPGVSNTVNFTLPTNGTKPYLCQNENYTFTNTSSNKTGWNSLWTFPGGSTSNLADAVFAFTTLGNNVPVSLSMDSAGCVFTSPTKTVNVRNCTDISDLAFDKSVAITPNPSNGNITLEMNATSSNVNITVFNILGAEVKNFTEDANGAFVKNYNLSDLANGAYIVRVKSGKQIATKRLVINK